MYTRVRPGAFRAARPFSSAATPPRRILKFVKISASLGAISTIAYFSSDSIQQTTRHAFSASERVGVVTVATFKCFNIYRKVLGTEYADPNDRKHALAEAHQRAADITFQAIQKNGGVYIKLGQHLSALTYLLPREWTDTMIPLQDRCPRSLIEEIKRLFRDDLGKELTDLFEDFDPNPVGVASLAQVHVGRLRSTGEKVAVKVQHPSLAEFVPLDVHTTQVVFSLMKRVFPEYPLTWLGDELQNSIFVELDFTNEAQNAQNTARNFEGLLGITALRIPEIVRAEKRVLIMEYVAGARLDDLDYMKKHHINTGEVSSCLSHIFNSMIFNPGFGLHCDPHGGNLAIRAVEKSQSGSGHNFEIVLYDHGLYRYIPVDMKRDYSHFWLAILDNDLPQMRKYAEKLAGIDTEQKFKIFASAITGRDPETALNYDIRKPRDENEIISMQSQLQSEGGVLEDLMYILSSMPRIVLLILKTNDLTRSLDENLKNPLGPERTFLILASYCAKVVYAEQKEQVRKRYRRWSWSWIRFSVSDWLDYQKRLSQLVLYDIYMFFHNLHLL